MTHRPRRSYGDVAPAVAPACPAESTEDPGGRIGARCGVRGRGRYRGGVSDRPEQAVDAAGSGAPPSPLLTPGRDGALGSLRDRIGKVRFGKGDVSLGRQFDAGSVPVTKSDAWMWLFFCGVGFLGGQVLATVLEYLSALIAGRSGQLASLAKLSEPPTWLVVSALFGIWGGFVGAAVLASRLRGTKRLAPDIGLRFRWIDVFGIPIGVCGQFVVTLLYAPIAPHIHDFHQRFAAPAQRLTGSSHGFWYAVIAVATVVGAPFVEEIFFRGVVMRALVRLLGRFGGFVGPSLAILISGCCFAALHFEALQFLGLATFGVILGMVSYRTGRLGMNMVAHASFNALALASAVVPGMLGLRGLA